MKAMVFQMFPVKNIHILSLNPLTALMTTVIIRLNISKLTIAVAAEGPDGEVSF